MAESLECVRGLIAAGYVGSICTPHVNAGYGHKNIDFIAQGVAALQQAINDANLSYRVWSGGELRLNEHLIGFMQRHGVVTLAGSRFVLADFWDRQWPQYVDQSMQWLIDRGYQPILAHPERQSSIADFDSHIDRLAAMGVWFQGNTSCMIGEQGPISQATTDRYLARHRYHVLGLDLHNPQGLRCRLDGLDAIRNRMGEATIDRLTRTVPRQIVSELTTDHAGAC